MTPVLCRMEANDSMKNLSDVVIADQIKQRVGRLKIDSERRWGRMSPAQALAHCSSGLEMAMGDIRPPRALIGRLIGSLIKPRIVGNDEAFRRNSPTIRELRVEGERDLEAERVRLCALIDRFVSGAPSVCTAHPHPFFGSLTPQEWSVLAYKHLDHHLRQFGV
jgi:uncharacterized protein DUF1569